MGLFGGAKTPSYTPPPAPPPAATPATLASAAVAQKVAGSTQQQRAAEAASGVVATSPQGVAPSSVSTAKQTLGGVS